MKINNIVIYLSIFFWIFPAIKQYKTKLFWYFFVFALTDPVVLIIRPLIMFTSNNPVYILSNFLLMLSVLWPFKNKKSIRILIVVVLSLCLFSFFSDHRFYFSLMILGHIIITYFFIKRTFMFIANSGKVNVFHLFLLLEEISIILKTSAVLISLQTGAIYFVATGAFEILIAIFFTLYREDNSKLHIDLRNA
ncbi:MAG: hypothetical protein NTX65_07215 [Ignavibacteriales bacterium]|nr:hypothetical protein [Ignavibacteriales bacterium]